MKKIIVLLVLSFLLTSCFGEKDEVVENKGEKQVLENEIYNNEEEEIDLYKNIPKDDIRRKTKYSTNFTGIQEHYFNNFSNLSILLTYIRNLEYQGKIEKKEKEYAKIIIDLSNNYLDKVDKNEISLKDYEKKYLIVKLLNKLGNNYHILGEDKKSIDNFNKAITNDENYYKTYVNLYNFHKDKGNTSESEKALNKFNEIIENNKIIEKINKDFKKYDNKNFGGFIDLGQIYLLKGKTVKAKGLFLKAKEVVKENKRLNEYEKNKILYEINNLLN